MVDVELSNSKKALSVAIKYNVLDESSLYRLKKHTVLHIVPSDSLLGKNIAVLTNYPSNEKGPFVRNQYTSLNWCSRFGEKLSKGENFIQIKDLEMYCEINVHRSGTFHFYILDEDHKSDGPKGSLYVQVEPDILVGKNKRNLKLEEIRCQTVLSKCLGPLNTWESKLRVTTESGYNLIHFTPIQELAASRSAYSLKNQLKTDPSFGKVGYEEVGKLIAKMRNEWEVASICDIVLNHTGNETEFLKDHPESTFSCFTCPHLRPAFLLDAMFGQVGNDIAGGLLEMVGVPQVIETESHLQALQHQLYTNYIPKLNIHEFFQIDIEKYVSLFLHEVRERQPPTESNHQNGTIKLNPKKDLEYRRKGVTICIEEILQVYNIFHRGCFDEDTRIKKCCESFRQYLEDYNNKIKIEVDNHMKCAVENALAGVRYERVQGDGPKIRVISHQYPVFVEYFTKTGAEKASLAELEKMMYDNHGKYFMAHNGWVMNCDPLNDFARPQPGIGNVYLRRELIAWGDSVKLRFGDKPEDSPFLWSHMKSYVDITAKYFDGIRLDNCHSTPLHVAEYLIDSARQVNPNLYVVAELFTNSSNTDNIFVNRLGITSLIREALAAWNSHEQGRLVYLYGGDPVGAFQKSAKRPLAPAIAHAIFFDQTHDNPSPVEKRSVFDLLPSAGLIAMACCATGSNRGYDELVPHHIHVVNEARQYQEWGKHANEKTGIIAAKRFLNDFHGMLATEGYNEVFVDQMNPDIVAVTRHHPKTHETYILIAHTAFGYPDANAGPTYVRPLTFEGKMVEIVFEAELHKQSGKPFERPAKFKKDLNYINGLNEYEILTQSHIQLEKSKIFKTNATIVNETTQLDFVNLKPGTVVIVKVAPHAPVRENINILQQLVSNFNEEKGEKYNEVQKIISKLDLVDLNVCLFSCNEEEQDRGFGFGAYNIPGFASMVYAGLQGFLSLLTEISPKNDLGHPFCNNLREGNWMIDYIHQRLTQTENTKPLAAWLEANLATLKKMPRYLIPSYFDVIITGIYELVIQHALNLMPDFFKRGSTFSQLLGLGSLQFVSVVKSALLPELSATLSPPKPPKLCATLSAGLPHFSTGYMRCWGRDTFISLRGILLLTGRYNEARYIILGFAECLRHGLIPNLLDGGKNARFNCRDAVWWWLYSIQQYITEAPNGLSILKENVSRLYPKDDSECQATDTVVQPLHDVMQEALQVHFQGLVYRERNAGTRIDEHMADNGFNNQIGIHPETGFVFGGNDANCGTWMDKMGSSIKAGNKGVPSTPRDGSAVELVGLQASVVLFLAKLAEKGDYPYSYVERTSTNDTGAVRWEFKRWAKQIEANFDKCFYVGENDNNPLANKRKIYKDTYGASRTFADFQLRCNFPVAMAICPEIFNPEHAWEALETAKKYLLGPLGMRTLDPEDWAYRGFYDNSNDSNDASVAHGANYHQGPEWLWPTGFYLRARLIFAQKLGKTKETVAETWRILTAHLEELRTSQWRGLPELTNKDGDYCSGSCRTQAWSIATVLEALYDLEKITGN